MITEKFEPVTLEILDISVMLPLHLLDRFVIAALLAVSNIIQAAQRWLLEEKKTGLRLLLQISQR